MKTTKKTMTKITKATEPVQCEACGGDHDTIDCENIKCDGCDKHPDSCICEHEEE